MIQKLESAGLGYHVSADETEDKLGKYYRKKMKLVEHFVTILIKLIIRCELYEIN